MITPEREDLIQRFIDGIATPDEAAELSGLIEASEAMRVAYLDLAEVHAALAADERLRAPAPVSRPKPPPRRLVPSRRAPIAKTRRSSALPWLAAAAVLLFSAVILLPRLSRLAFPARADSVPTGVAVLAGVADAVWSDPSPAPGGSLAPGRLKLESGMAAIEFNSGARVLLEGPAELELISGMRAFCRGGKLRAHVPPPAHGFTIETPSSRVVDLGTTFGLSVREDGSALVKVMQGKVELGHGDAVHALGKDAAALIDPAGKPNAVSSPDEAFPSEENFNDRVAAGARLSAARWQSAAAALAKDPATVLSFNFQESTSSSRSVRNHAAGGSVESHGTLVGTAWTQGRWPGKRALEFNGRSDRMLFKLSGTAPAATYLAWIRVDSLPNLYHILLMPDWLGELGLQWMVTGQGEVRLALSNGKGNPGTAAGWDGPVKTSAVSNLDLGRWIFLASTYDSSTGTVVHYRDGQAIGTGAFPSRLPVKFGTYSFGNWNGGSRDISDKRPDDRYRNFNGRLDELAILSRALSAGEIARLYQEGKP